MDIIGVGIMVRVRVLNKWRHINMQIWFQLMLIVKTFIIINQLVTQCNRYSFMKKSVNIFCCLASYIFDWIRRNKLCNLCKYCSCTNLAGSCCSTCCKSNLHYSNAVEWGIFSISMSLPSLLYVWRISSIISFSLITTSSVSMVSSKWI